MEERDFLDGEKGVLELLAKGSLDEALAILVEKYVEAVQGGDKYVAKLIAPELCGTAQRLVDKESKETEEEESRVSSAADLICDAALEAARRLEVSEADVEKAISELIETAFPRGPKPTKGPIRAL